MKIETSLPGKDDMNVETLLLSDDKAKVGTPLSSTFKETGAWHLSGAKLFIKLMMTGS